MYAYNAELWCDDCGANIVVELEREGRKDTGDTNDFPQYAIEGESDGPNHCASRENCVNALTFDGEKVGALIDESLTDEGVSYLREMLEEPNPSKYQRELHDYWRSEFSDYL